MKNDTPFSFSQGLGDEPLNVINKNKVE